MSADKTVSSQATDVLAVRRAYEAPALIALGTLADLTEGNDEYKSDDPGPYHIGGSGSFVY